MEERDPAQRIDELLVANNMEVSRRRDAEAKAEQMAQAIVALVQEKMAAATEWTRVVRELQERLDATDASLGSERETVAELHERITELEQFIEGTAVPVHATGAAPRGYVISEKKLSELVAKVADLERQLTQHAVMAEAAA